MLCKRRIRWWRVSAACMAAFFVCTCAYAASAAARMRSPLLVELRQYVTYPGKRDELISLFENHFVEPQEELGMMILGTFREPEHPSHFTWLRGFGDMESRAQELNAFYSGPVWTAYRNVANPTMEDSDNVLLLREAYSGSGFVMPSAERAPIGSSALPDGLVVVNIYYLRREPQAGFIEFFKGDMLPELNRVGIRALAALVPEAAPNNYPKLKIREGESLFIWVARFADAADYQRHLAALEQRARWRNHVSPTLDAQLNSPPEILKLQPTARSLLH
jgi:hypothetical protein